MTKTCAKCGLEKPPEHFSKAKRNKSGLASYCKSCHNSYTYAPNKEWRKANPGRAKEISRRYYETHKEAARLSSKKCQLRRVYGMTLEDLAALRKKQDGQCAICLRSDRALHVDHIDTSDGPKIRGLLCMMCNTALGHLQEDAALCYAAGEYVKRNA